MRGWRAKILANSRAKGLFAGATLEGSSLRSDDERTSGSTGGRCPEGDCGVDRSAALRRRPGQWRSALGRIVGESRASR